MKRLPIQMRQTKVFELVVAGRSYPEICAALNVSEDTIARDMKAVAEQVQGLTHKRHGEILAVALAQIAETRAAAQREYTEDRRRERAWKAGKFDYQQHKRRAGEGGAEQFDEYTNIRPPYRVDRAKYLDIMRRCVLDLVELTGVKRVFATPTPDGSLTIEVAYADD